MMTLDDIGTLGLTAAHEAAEFIVENIVKDKQNPTPEEAEAVAATLIITITALEMNLKMNLPEAVRHNTRAAIEAMSGVLGTKVSQIRAAKENEISETPDRPGA